MSITPRRFMFWGWCAGWGVVAYLCLTPHSVQLHASDKADHFVGYALVTLAAATFAHDQRQLRRAALTAAVLSTLFEFGQALVPSRLFELADLAANLGGVAVGWAAGSALLRLRDRLFTPATGRA